MRVTDELMETPGAMASHLSLLLSYRIGILSHAVHCTRAVECLTRRFFSDTLRTSASTFCKKTLKGAFSAAQRVPSENGGELA